MYHSLNEKSDDAAEKLLLRKEEALSIWTIPNKNQSLRSPHLPKVRQNPKKFHLKVVVIVKIKATKVKNKKRKK